jgi:hypothetical protein
MPRILNWQLTFLDLLEEPRNRMRAELCQLLQDGIDFIRGYSEYGWGKNRSFEYKIIQFEYGLLRMLNVPISEIVKRIEAVSCEDMRRTRHSGSYHDYYHEAPTHSETLAGKLETIKEKVSIYLNYAKSGDAATPYRF